jgi:PIN domain nuclease of toxin-antitoxin system
LIVLDTHVLIWAVQGDRRLGKAARAALDETMQGDALAVSAMTPWEIAMLAERGRLALGRDVGAWIAEALALPGVSLLPLDPAISVDSVRLPGAFHADPADRIIIATARRHDAPLMTADRAILAYGAKGYVRTVDAGR